MFMKKLDAGKVLILNLQGLELLVCVCGGGGGVDGEAK